MQQIKLFLGSDEELGKLESEVNAWLRASNVTPTQISGNLAPRALMKTSDNKAISTEGGMRRFAPSDVLVMVTYTVA
jgi:hypothetical protein